MNLNAIEIKAFVPAKDFEISKRFYTDIGFTKKSEGDGVAYFAFQNTSFLLQDYYSKEFAENLTMHLLVDSADNWYNSFVEKALTKKYSMRLTAPEKRPWKMIDFTFQDPAGVCWRIGQNI